MVAVSRFVEFATNAQTFVSGASTDAEAQGTRGFCRGTNLGSGDDKFTITAGSNNELAVTINGVGPNTITLASGTDLDARFVARDIGFKLHSASSNNAFKFAQCEFRNGGGGTNDRNSFIIYSGVLGSNASANDVTLGTASNDAKATLGFDTRDEIAGSDFAGTYTGSAVVSGTFGGQFDDTYTIVISEDETVADATGGGTYATNGGVITTGGIYTGTAENTYTVLISTSQGNVMGAGSGNVPEFTVTDTPGSDQNANPIELLYPDHWYDVGDLGVRTKFTDAVFGDGDTFTIVATPASGTGYPKAIGAAEYIWTSSREDSSKAFGIPAITSNTVPTQVGTKGVEIAFSGGSNLDEGDTFQIICRGPQPLVEDTTQLNFGNVTVSTKSSVKTVWFEIISGAVLMNTVKFSLQSDGTFQHHDQGDNDTEFHFGTVGGGDPAPGAGPTSSTQVEFPVASDGLGSVAATDIDSDTAPTTLSATKADLAVVSSADASEDISNFQGALVSDFVFLAINLGANETGANSTINYRMYFDFS
jgi:hypothetical protein